MRKLVSLAALGALAVALCFAQSNDRPKPAAPHGSSTLRLLNQRIPEISFSDTPFEQVMDWVTEYSQANVIVRWQTLTDAGVERDHPISLKLRNIRLSQVLWMIISDAGSAGIKLAYRASGNNIIVSTEDDLNKEMVVKVYDVADMLVNPPRFTNAARLDPTQGLNSLGQGGAGGGGGGGGGSGIFGGGQQGVGNENDQGQNVVNDMQRLVQLITDTVEPDSWVANGGTGTIQPFRTVLVIRNTLLVHQRLGGYLEEAE